MIECVISFTIGCLFSLLFVKMIFKQDALDRNSEWEKFNLERIISLRDDRRNRQTSGKTLNDQ